MDGTVVACHTGVGVCNHWKRLRCAKSGLNRVVYAECGAEMGERKTKRTRLLATSLISLWALSSITVNDGEKTLTTEMPTIRSRLTHKKTLMTQSITWTVYNVVSYQSGTSGVLSRRAGAGHNTIKSHTMQQ
jgi:hypothetical protein